LASLGHSAVITRAVGLLTVIAGAVTLFIFASWLLRIEGFNEFLRIITRKLKRR
jgi:hypothetical protein